MELLLSQLFIEFVLFEIGLIIIAASFVAVSNYSDHGTIY